MQSKGALKFLTIVLAIACAYQLSFTLVTRNVEKKAAIYAGGDAAKEQNYLDSIKTQTVYNLGLVKFNFKECKDKEINLGLDLRGGMNVMLEISIEDVIRGLSNNNPDPAFNQALAQAKEAEKNSTKNYIVLFKEAYEKIVPGGRLSFIFNTPELRDVITPESSNDQVVAVLRKQADVAIENSYNVLRNRIDRFGVTQPNIQRLENSGRILVELPGVKDPERVRKLLQGSASLEFWTTYSNTEIYPLLVQANGFIKEYLAANKVDTLLVNKSAEAGAVATSKPDSLNSLLSQLGDSTKTAAADKANAEADFPLFSKLTPNVDYKNNQVLDGPVVGRAMSKDTAVINKYLALPQVKGMLRDLDLMWTMNPTPKGSSIYELIAVRKNTRDGKPPLDGGSIVDASESYSQQGSSAEVSVTMNASGSRTWARLTADNIGKSVAICLDGYVYSYPRVNQEITGGRTQITGDFTIDEARDLAIVLKSGKLPAPARIIQDTVVGPSLGQESINAGILSFILAFALVLLYMWFFYNSAGLVANIVLVTNLFFLFGILVSFGAVLTLPGIAGIVLTMGMAVDANVIIYERIKEERKLGKSLSLAVSDGFKNAYSAIIDGQMTTLITGIVLFIFGTGPVQGFATTLIIGIITSVFTAIFITRIIFVTLLEKGKKFRFSNKYTENFLSNTKFDFIKARKITYIVSVIILVVVAISLVTRGVNYGVDFSGGRAYVIRFDKDVKYDQVEKSLGTVFTGSNSYEVKQFGNAKQWRVVTQYKYDDTSEAVPAEIDGMLYKALGNLNSEPLTLEQFSTTILSPYGIVSSDKVGPSVAHNIKVNSIIAVLLALLAIGLYITIRFKRWQWAAGGVVSLAHDSVITIGMFSLLYGVLPFNLEIDQAFIAAILTIIGYSINDTVIIFDRIREYRRVYPKRGLKENINNAINSTLSRTVNTAGTTTIVLLAIFIFGGEVIRGFVFALLFGVVIGTFSSVFVATPVAYDLILKKGEKNKDDEEEKEK